MAGTEKNILVEQISLSWDDYKPIFRITTKNNKTANQDPILKLIQSLDTLPTNKRKLN